MSMLGTYYKDQQDRLNRAANSTAASANTGGWSSPLTAWQAGIQSGNNRTAATVNEMSALNPLQVQLQNMLLNNFMGGAGEFGFGSSAKQANSTLASGLAGRGISPDSGVAQGALGQMLAQMYAGDMENRRKYGLNLLQTNPAYYNSATGQYGNTDSGGGLGSALGGILGGIAPMLAYNWTS